jgi:hypothetical protein
MMEGGCMDLFTLIKMTYSLRNRTAKKESSPEPTKVPAKKASGTKKASKAAAAKTKVILKRPSFPLNDAKAHLVQQIAILGVSKPSEILEKTKKPKVGVVKKAIEEMGKISGAKLTIHSEILKKGLVLELNKRRKAILVASSGSPKKSRR